MSKHTKNRPFARSADGGDVFLDPSALITTKALVTANSGGGKSYALRKMCELVGPVAPLVVLDMEGEFVTLRERIDLVIVGPGGEVPADVRSAPLLARRLVERSLSAVVDLSEMRMDARRSFVAGFCRSLVELPKSLWRPLFVVLDEAHQFCPERGHGEAESTDAVIDLCTLGRKRSFCTILATQRVSTLHKTAAGECNNKLLGRMTLDLDVKRAAFELATSPKETLDMLRGLPAGEFYSFGPAFRPEGVTRIRVNPVDTTHPKPGRGNALVPPAPSSAVKAVLAELADLPKQAEAETRDLAELRRRLAAVTAERDRLAVAPPPSPAGKAIEQARAANAALRGAVDQLRAGNRSIPKLYDALGRALDMVKEQTAALAAPAVVDPESIRQILVRTGDDIQNLLASADLQRASNGAKVRARAAKLAEELGHLLGIARPEPVAVTAAEAAGANPVAPSVVPAAPAAPAPPANAVARGELSKPYRKLIDAVAWWNVAGVPKPTAVQVGLVSGYVASGGSFGTYLSALSTAGLIRRDSGTVALTDAGESVAERPAGTPTLAELHDRLRSILPGPHLKLLNAVIKAGPPGLTNVELGELTGYTASGGSFGTYLSKLSTLGLVDRGAGRVSASEVVFPPTMPSRP